MNASRRIVPRVNIPCRNPVKWFKFILNDTREVQTKAGNEDNAAAQIPAIFGDDIKWAVSKATGIEYHYD